MACSSLSTGASPCSRRASASWDAPLGPLAPFILPLPHQLTGIFRILLPPDRIPHSKVDLPASTSRRADGVRRFGLADFSVTVARRPSVPLQLRPRHPRGRIADPVVPRDRPEQTTMEGSGQRSRGMAIAARHGRDATVRFDAVSRFSRTVLTGGLRNQANLSRSAL